VYSLLRRYELDTYSCNHSLFYKLNKLKKGTALKIGKYYFIPVQVRKFNSKSIRTSIGISDFGTAKSIQDYNERMYKEGNRAKDFRTDKKLWVPHHILNCDKADINAVQAPQLPEKPEDDLATSTGGARQFPIFGKEHQHVPLKSNKLAGKVFYVVSGHGGPDPGAIGTHEGHKLAEDEYAYDISLRLLRKLVENGATAYMIVRDPNDGIRSDKYLKRDYDEVVWGGAKVLRQQKARLAQRTGKINELYKKHKKAGVVDQKAVIIHIDSRSRSQKTDMFFYFAPGSLKGQRFAERLKKTIQKKYEEYQPGRGYNGTVTARDLFLLRETTPPAVYIELGNIRNSSDQHRFIQEYNRQAVADWLYEGLVK